MKHEQKLNDRTNDRNEVIKNIHIEQSNEYELNNFVHGQTSVERTNFPTDLGRS